MGSTLRSRDFSKKKIERVENIEAAFYAVDRALKAAHLQGIHHYSGKNYKPPPNSEEFRILVHALTNRAAEMLLEAFDGQVNGKKLPKPKKEQR